MIWLLKIDALNGAGDPVTLRFSSGRYDAPNDDAYDPRMKQPGLFQSGLFAGDLLDVSRSGYGATTLANTDGGLNYLADYAIDGRQAQLSLAKNDGTVQIVVQGMAAGIAFEDRMISIRLRDPQEILAQNHPSSTYAGDNVLPLGLEGTEDDIKGSQKPRVYGVVRNAEPVAVNTSLLIYQVSDRPDTSITAVYDKGATLTKGDDYDSLEALQSDDEPAAGSYRRFQGYVRLGDEPVGTVTVDAQGDAVNAGDVMQAVAKDAGWGLDADDQAALNPLGQVGVFVNQAVTTQALLDQLAVSIGGYWRVSGLGVLRAQPLVAPAGAKLTLQDFQIKDISRTAIGVGANGLPYWKVNVQADHIETTQTDLAGIVTASRTARLAKAYREASAISEATHTRHPLAGELTLESRLVSLGDAETLAARALELVSVRRDRISLTAFLTDVVTLDVGDAVEIVTSKLGYQTGRNLLVVGMTLDARRSRATLELWG